MNKQELIKKVKENGIYGLNIFGTVVEGIPTKTAIELIKQLNKSQKPVVPEFVAEWYEENKDDFEFNVWDWIAFRNEPEKLENKEFNYWINDGEGTPIQTLVNMHQFGYEVEEEKRYEVKIKASGQYLARTKLKEISFMYNGACSHFTRKELEEADFGWVFDCPGIKIEEVTE